MKLKEYHNRAKGIITPPTPPAVIELIERVEKLEEEVKMIQRYLNRQGRATPVSERKLLEKFGMQAEDDKNKSIKDAKAR